MADVLVGIDVGTSGLKGLAIDPDGTVVARAERNYPLSTPRPGWAEQDPADWWEAASAVLAELRASAGRPAGIGLTGQMHGLVVLDSSGEVLRPAILWNDQRTGAECAEIERTVGLERLISLTGNRALPGFTAPKLLWLRKHEPSVYARVSHVMLPKDYVRLRLTGEPGTDVSDASGTLLLDVSKRAWSRELADAFDVDPDWLPPVHESPTVAGETADGTPVAAGAGDQAAGALGVDATTEDGPASLVLGTSGVVFAARGAYTPDPQGRLHAFCHALPETWHVMGVILSAAGALSWLADAVGASDDITGLLEQAAGWEPGVEGLRFAPYLAGERTPHADADVRGAFTGLGLRHDRGALARAVLEGVGFALRDALDLVAESGRRPDLARVTGGGARSDLWLKILAAILDLPLQRTASEAGAAFGAALLGGVAGGVFDDARTAAHTAVRPADVIEPDPEWVERYAALRPGFEALYPALTELPA
jgi:xylulokinase